MQQMSRGGGLVVAFVLSASVAHAQAVVYSPTPLPLVVGFLEPVAGGDLVALRTAANLYISVQPDGTVQTRPAANSWESATRIGTSVLRYDGAGAPRYLFIGPVATPVVIVIPPIVIPPIVVAPSPVPPPNIQTADPALVLIRVSWWLTYFNQNTPANVDYWMGVIQGTLYPAEAHTPGWTADSYWPDKMRAGYGDPVK